MKNQILAASLFLLCAGACAQEDVIGSVDTAFKLVGANHKVVVRVFDDPAVAGVSCYVTTPETGGVLGTVGLAEDTSDASVACRQIGPIVFKGPLPRQGEAFSKRASPLFKRTRVVRMVDPKRQTLIYMVYSDKLIDGSPRTSVTVVPVGKPIPLAK
jgi:CreA protein